jgi:hypothetical protein
VALFEARIDIARSPHATQTFGLCTVGLIQVKAIGLIVVFDYLLI